MSDFTNQIGKYVTSSLSNLANKNFSTYALSLLSDAASLIVGRSVGSSESYNAFLDYVSSLGHNPKGVFGKSYPFIYTAMVGNNSRADEISEGMFNFPKFTFYKTKPDIVLSDPENDIKEYFGQFIPDAKFSSDMKHGYELKYAENNGDIQLFTPHPGDAHGSVGSFNATSSSLGTNDLITKTNELFNQGKMKTIIARFHTWDEQSKDVNNQTQTAISTKYGMSHGRNLLSGHDPQNNGYDNPYCRVWTYHHQYKDFARTMRPFVDGYNDGTDGLSPITQSELNDTYSWYAMGNNSENGTDTENFGGIGRGRLDKLGVLSNKTGRPNIVPIYESIDESGNILNETKKTVDIKNCMFSIENLAWKVKGRDNKYFDINGLSDEQKGPMGGRIMWFPPYNLSFDETIKPNWKPTEFIGRGEPIYTYSNTTRSGNLSFTMLIDHPAILDYWKGWQKNGQRNNGKTLSDLNTGGVDNPSNQEQTLLRFFAGCEILEATPRQCKVKKKKVKIEKETNLDTHTPVVSEPKRLIFFVYFPNNYSGKDDDAQKAMYYLANGVGSQHASKLATASTISGSSMSIDDLISEITLDKLSVSGIIASVGGYEMHNASVDFCTADSVQDLTYAGASTANCEYSDYITNNTPGTRAFQYEYLKPDGTTVKSPLAIHNSSYTLTACPITDNAIQYKYGDGSWCLAAKYIGSNAITSWESNKERYLYRWYYRVDSDTQNQLLKVPHGYIDGTSNRLNSTGYEEVKSHLSDYSSADTLVSFADVITALEGIKAEETLTGCYASERVDTVKKVLKEEGNIKISSIDVYGAASSHGNKKVYNSKTKTIESQTNVDMDRNNTLASHRASTVASYLTSKLDKTDLIHSHSDDKVTKTDNKAVYSTSILKEFGTSETPSDVDDLQEKIYRSAAVVIEYTEEAVTDATVTNSPEETAASLGNSNPNTTTVTAKDSTEAAQVKKEADSQKETVEQNGTLLQASDASAQVISAATKQADTVKKEDEYELVTMPRYDNEGEFFKELQTHDPNAMNLISQKVQYFDPAFHSISPEGFAARLTFLQQCARQGNTVGASDVNAETANNLAFGAPPVCVLRIGDFYYTRIIIDNINIKYEKPVWDLNPEGIGVMPMMADITINFNFIGGSDLGGPISRLQNAVSFNYYANTSVYDNRAEQVAYGDNGEMTHFKAFEVEQTLDQDEGDNSTTTTK